MEVDPDKYDQVTEGKAKILYPKQNEVFYNPVQEFNRDMSIASISTWREKLYKKEKAVILEGLSASGLRSIRYAKEIEGIQKIVANDLSEEAVESIKRNIAYNEIPEGKVEAHKGDVMEVLYSHRESSKQYEVIDLDPYGSAAQFIDGAVQSVKSGGLLCITCTDLAVLASMNHPETCFAKYGGMPMKSEFKHELALRLLLYSVQSSAAKYKRRIKPLMSCSIDFYIRVFIVVYDSPKDCKDGITDSGIVVSCTKCHSFGVQPFGKKTALNNQQNNFKYTPSVVHGVSQACSNCGSSLKLGGPCYLSDIHDKTFVDSLYEHICNNPGKFGTEKRMKGMVKVISEELSNPFFYTLTGLCSSVKMGACPPIIKVTSAICNAGYKVSCSHTCPGSIKTDAPDYVIWDIVRELAKTCGSKQVDPENREQQYIGNIINKPQTVTNVDFTYNANAVGESRKIKLVRYQVNPTKNWGPKKRHRSN